LIKKASKASRSRKVDKWGRDQKKTISREAQEKKGVRHKKRERFTKKRDDGASNCVL